MEADEIAIDIIDVLSKCCFVMVKSETMKKSLELHKKHQFSYYDGLIVASAIECQCDFIFSEDLQNEQIIEGLTIRNIFV